jgi:5-methylcytosine-specific restriction protein A
MSDYIDNSIPIAKHFHTGKTVKRLSSHARGYTHRWRKRRLAFLAKYPLCYNYDQGIVEVGCTRFAEDVDHIENDRSKDADEDLRGYCHSCHSKKTYRQDGSFGRKKI